MRIPTLMLGIAPVLIGVSAACRVIGMRGADGLPACGILTASSACDAGTGRIITLGLLCLLVALFLQIAVNFANDYSDGVRGTDAHRTAAVRQYTVESDFQFLENGATAEEERQARELNGPTRLVAGGVTPRAVLMAAIVNAVLACVCGLPVIVITGYWWLVFVGALCVTAAWFYVGGSHPYGYFGFGELAAFVFFGPVAALGTQFVLCGQVNGNGVYGAVVIGAVSAAVMAVNNLRDVNTDRESGKRTLAVRIGARAFTVCLCVLIALVMLAMVIPWSVMWIHMDSDLPNLSVLGGYCAVLGEIALILLTVVVEFNVAKREYRSAMRNLSWIALAVALVFVGLTMSI